MAGEAAVPLAEPVSPTSTTKNAKTLNETTTAARENQVTVEDFAPGDVTESVVQNEEERTGTGDGKDQSPFVAPSILDFGRSSQVKPLPLQLATAAEPNPQTQVHPKAYKDRPTSELPHATQSILQANINAQSKSIPKTLIVEKEWWKSGFRRVLQGKRTSKKFRSPDISGKNVRDDSRESLGLDDDDKEQVTGDYSKEGSGLDDGDKQVTADCEEGSKARGIEDGSNLVTGERRPLIDYQNIGEIRQQRSRRPDTSYSYSDVPATPPFMAANYSAPPSLEMPTDKH